MLRIVREKARRGRRGEKEGGGTYLDGGRDDVDHSKNDEVRGPPVRKGRNSKSKRVILRHRDDEDAHNRVQESARMKKERTSDQLVVEENQRRTEARNSQDWTLKPLKTRLQHRRGISVSLCTCSEH